MISWPQYVSKRQLFCQFQPTVNNFQRQTLPQKGDFPTSKLLKCRPMIWIQKGHINILCLLLIEVECISLYTTQFLLLLLQMSLCCSFESMSKLSGVSIGKKLNVLALHFLIFKIHKNVWDLIFLYLIFIYLS